MKKVWLFALMIGFVFALIACRQTEKPQSSQGRDLGIPEQKMEQPATKAAAPAGAEVKPGEKPKQAQETQEALKAKAEQGKAEEAKPGEAVKPESKEQTPAPAPR
jgi:hypothetical protein